MKRIIANQMKFPLTRLTCISIRFIFWVTLATKLDSQALDYARLSDSNFLLVRYSPPEGFLTNDHKF